MRASPCSSSPRQVRVGLGRLGQGLGVSAVSSEPERAVGCVLSRSWSWASHGIASASSVDPDPVLSFLVDPETVEDWSLDPACRTLRSEDRPIAPGRRAGPVRLMSGVSPGFPRRRVPWPVDVRTKAVMRQAPYLAPMCTTGPAAVDKPVNIGGRIKFALADQRFVLSTRRGRCGLMFGGGHIALQPPGALWVL